MTRTNLLGNPSRLPACKLIRLKGVKKVTLSPPLIRRRLACFGHPYFLNLHPIGQLEFEVFGVTRVTFLNLQWEGLCSGCWEAVCVVNSQS